MKFIGIYLALINSFGILIMYLDKQKAKKGQWRISEATLFSTAILLGSVGILAGMYLFHHKTKHLKFILGIPVILFVQIYILYKLMGMN